MKGISGKKVLITGAASGIGRATADRFYKEGAVLCLVDMPPLEKTELNFQFPERMTYISADITSKEGQEKISNWIKAEGIDVLVNNAGITKDATMGKMNDDDWDQVINVNLTAAFKLAKIATTNMREQNKGGVILNTASVVAHYGNFGQSNYVASKAGLIGMTKTMAKEFGKYQIRTNAVAPGFIATAMVKAMPEKVLGMMQDKVPLKRLGEPDEIAATFAFLASDDAKYINGACINVDGGIILG